MANKAEARIYRQAAWCIAFFVVSLIVPRFVPNPEGGFASGVSAILVFLAMLFGLCIFSLFLLARTIRDFHTISAPARIAGMGPSVVLVVGLAILLGILRY